MVIAIIGSRKMSSYGKEVVGWVVPEIVKRGWGIVTADVFGVNREVIRIGKGKAEVVKGNNLYEINYKIALAGDKLLIIEGGEKSGTILVAKEVIELGKEVWVVPGRLGDEGSEVGLFLAKNGAYIFTQVTDLE